MAGWESRLNSFIKARQGSGFVWGENDCCLFGADAVQIQTGIDPAIWFRDKYDTEKGALKSLTVFLKEKFPNIKIGGFSFSDRVEMVTVKVLSDINALEVNPLSAKRGDIMFATLDGDICGIGVVELSGTHFIAPSLKNGLQRLPVKEAKRAWTLDGIFLNESVTKSEVI